MNDIAASHSATWTNGDGFKSIGEDGSVFTGVIGGDGQTVTGITNTTDLQGGSLVYYNDGTIKNITMSNIDLKNGAVLGGLVGYNNGTIDNVSYDGTIIGSNYVGGLVGEVILNYHNLYRDMYVVFICMNANKIRAVVGKDFESEQEVIREYETVFAITAGGNDIEVYESESQSLPKVLMKETETEYLYDSFVSISNIKRDVKENIDTCISYQKRNRPGKPEVIIKNNDIGFDLDGMVEQKYLE